MAGKKSTKTVMQHFTLPHLPAHAGDSTAKISPQ